MTEEHNTFDEMGLNDNLLRGIFSYGFEYPSNIQKKSIKLLNSGKDLIAQSQSGTGKTGAFVIGSLNKINENNKNIQIIILSPTRELATQIYNVATSLSQYMNIKTTLLIGGNQLSLDNTKKELKDTQLIIGTPGKIYDLINRNILNINKLDTLILDEADEMLSKDFKEQIFNILKFVNNKIQVVLYSATLSKDILDTVDNILDDPIKILIQNEELTLQGIRQFYINTVYDKYKVDALIDIYSSLSINQTIIYVNTINRAMQLENKLKYQGLSSNILHSKLNQSERNDILSNFRSGSSRILISTDIIARGIDIQSVSIIINYDIPNYKETYIHRIGRSGRYGRKGYAINFCCNNDINKLKIIEEFYSTSIEEFPANYKDILN
tara:strand:+ start:1249 stop:2394 length:1146 start_codon:yes stop_codon:yes gene_type:complete